MEFGAGTTISTVRRRGEGLQREGATLMRINPRDGSGPPGTIHLNSGALEAMAALARHGLQVQGSGGHLLQG